MKGKKEKRSAGGGQRSGEMAVKRIDLPLPACGGCGAVPGQPHADDCDVERCSVCGSQRIICTCNGHDKAFARWTGFRPGEAEAIALGTDLNCIALKGLNEILFVKPGSRPKGKNLLAQAAAELRDEMGTVAGRRVTAHLEKAAAPHTAEITVPILRRGTDNVVYAHIGNLTFEGVSNDGIVWSCADLALRARRALHASSASTIVGTYGKRSLRLVWLEHVLQIGIAAIEGGAA